MAHPGAIAHSRALLCPRASTLSLSSSVAPLSPLGLGVLGRGSVRSLPYFTTLRMQVRSAIEFVSGKEGLRPLFCLLGVLLYCVSGIRALQARLLALPEVCKRPWPLWRPRGDGNAGRFVPLALPSCVARSAPVVRRTSDAVPFWSLYSDGPLSSRPQPLGSVGDDTPCEDTREDVGLSV